MAKIGVTGFREELTLRFSDNLLDSLEASHDRKTLLEEKREQQKCYTTDTPTKADKKRKLNQYFTGHEQI